MAKEIGRNEPCPCGSGKKWKKCHGNPANDDKEPPAPEAFLEALGLDRDLQVGDILPELVRLTKELREFDPIQVISAGAMLASLADNHTLIFRLDTLILLAASHGAGKRVPSVEDLDRWLNTDIPESEVGRFEDPPEDFALGLVRTEDGDRLIFNGYLSGPDAYLQDVLDTLAAGPSALAPIRLKAKAALSLSNELVRRRGYDRFTAGSHTPDRVILPESDEELWRLVLTQMFTPADFTSLTSFEADLQPFVCTLEQLQQSALEQRVVQVRELSTPQPRVSVWWKVLEFLAQVAFGVLLVYLSVAGFVALLKTPQFQTALIVFAILIGLLWWLWSLLPEWFRKLVRRSLRRKERRHER